MTTSSKSSKHRLNADGLSPPEANGRKSRAEHILDVTATLLLRWGFRKTTVDDVAREAGVAKGTIYLHWKTKQELFLAALMRAQQDTTAEVLRRIAADPEGGLLHRVWTHGMMAVLTNPLMAAILSGKTDAFAELRGAFDPAAIHQLTDDFDAYILQLQQAGLIRDDVPVPVIAFVTSALKVGLISTPDILGPEQTPPTEQLVEAMSDLLCRWLEPSQAAGDATAGTPLATRFVEKIKEVESQLERTE